MSPTDRKAFGELIAGVYEFYGKQPSSFVLDIWWQAMQQFDLDTVRQALGKHCMNPDTGQFLPRPADVVKMLAGSTLDSAQLAWTKVMEATHAVGSYETVCFDDPLINAVLADMGGWIAHGQVKDDELPFRQKQFEQRYRAYVLRGCREWPTSLPGIFERDNRALGFEGDVEPRLIGDQDKARRVCAGGAGQPLPSMRQLAERIA